MPVTHIGNNCIVCWGSVVKGYFNDNTIIFSNPAKGYHLSTDEWLKKVMEDKQDD